MSLSNKISEFVFPMSISDLFMSIWFLPAVLFHPNWRGETTTMWLGVGREKFSSQNKETLQTTTTTIESRDFKANQNHDSARVVSILPSTNVVVFDQAHDVDQLPKVAFFFFLG